MLHAKIIKISQCCTELFKKISGTFFIETRYTFIGLCYMMWIAWALLTVIAWRGVYVQYDINRLCSQYERSCINAHIQFHESLSQPVH